MTSFDLCSDLHLCFNVDALKIMPRADTLVMAGDIVEIELLKGKQNQLAKQVREFLHKVSTQYKTVYWVMGNHEFYGGSLTYGINNARTILKNMGIENITILERQTVEHEDCLIFGATLWTSCNNRNPIVMNAVQAGMNDYRSIKLTTEYFEDRYITTDDTVMLHERAIVKLKEFIATETDKKKLVITHMAPSFKSVAEEFRFSTVNDGYATELHDMIYDSDIKCWVHGHIHESVNYTINNTVIRSNPRGYYGYESSAYSYEFQTIEV